MHECDHAGPLNTSGPGRKTDWEPVIVDLYQRLEAVLERLPVAVALDAAGNATPALLKRLQGLGADVSNPQFAVAGLKRAMDGKAEALFYESMVKGATLVAGLQKALEEAIAKLPIPKVMSYQLESGCELPGWTSVSFVRPAHALIVRQYYNIL